ncbi:hypothetical protein IMZ08_14330 [Bacillus luteolus]|uniref:ABC transporter permease n=1 Tax=Litchfieldia luteola TaxID=682179 RepID=A0ABR9QL60_9BACI|nr:hypothetical protein [Cytobacillus luteolus]MBE4909240.1 hypothetical protein [Cytobacillus luteolus]MBP1940303.1 ABC-type transport system involved in multi-copper enzyme maturation permease subunit [Cytobacillus luteolus]
MQLLKFELYKIFKQTSAWVTFIIMLGMSYLSLNYPYESKVEREIYQQWEGPLTEEVLVQAKNEYAALVKKEEQRVSGDEEVIFSDLETMQLWMYQKIILSEHVEKENERRLNELKTKNTNSAEMEMKMIEEIRVDDFVHHTGPSQTVAFVQFGSFLVLGVMLLIGLAPIYSREYATGMDNYLFSSKKGRKPLALAKIWAALIYTFLVVVGWESFNFILNYILHGKGGWETPIQFYTLYMDPAYADSPYAFTMFEYHLIQLGIHLLAGLSFALLIVLISSFCKNALITFFLSAAIFIAPEFLRIVESLQTILSFSYLQVSRVEFLFNDFKAIDVFGYPILYPVAACIIMVLLGTVCVLAILRIINKRELSS